jgi:hypothetical protein
LRWELPRRERACSTPDLVFVAGRQVKRDGEVVGVDQTALHREAAYTRRF